jgi:hypothetical protein
MIRSGIVEGAEGRERDAGVRGEDEMGEKKEVR